MTQHLLHIHIGPMQEFIAAARRTRDLWFGSWLMSELSKAVARGVAEEAGQGSLVFPAAAPGALRPETDLAVANKIVAIVANPQAAAEAGKKALDQRLAELGKQVLDTVNGKLASRAVAEVQIADLPEFYWVAVPLPDEQAYPQARLKAEILLAARKNCRNFGQPAWGSERPKSSLDGNRESVILKEISGDSQKMYLSYKAKAGEQLSGVDLLKRLGKSKQRQSFPSTSHVASMPLRHKLRDGDDKLRAAWEAYMGLLPDDLKQEERVSGGFHPVFGQADGALLFESRLRDYYGAEVPENVKQALGDFLKKAEASPVNPYYALLVGDGDKMGETINNLVTLEAHRQFSQTLAGFAGKAGSIIEANQGAAVYTGGDDVMALLPLHTMIKCADELAYAFRKMMQDKGYHAATFSAGIAICHHMEPLEDALGLARQAEKEAKSVPGKNALAIIEAKRSGADRTVKGKWSDLDWRLLDIADYYQLEQLPHGLAYQLRAVALHLGGETAVARDERLRSVLKAEAERIIKRKEGSPEAQRRIIGMVNQLSKHYTMTQLVNELIIANTVAQAAEQSGDKLPRPEKQEATS